MTLMQKTFGVNMKAFCNFLSCIFYAFSDTEEATKWKAILIPNPALLQDDTCLNNDPALSAYFTSLFAQVNLGRL